jgi:hypothetical protein
MFFTIGSRVEGSKWSIPSGVPYWSGREKTTLPAGRCFAGLKKPAEAKKRLALVRAMGVIAPLRGGRPPGRERVKRT